VTVLHGSFELPFPLRVPPPRAFAAFADPEVRTRWFRLPGRRGAYELDFRVGGGEVAGSTFAPAGADEQLRYRSRFLDIVADERIVLTYEFSLDGRRRWASLVTVEIAPDAEGCVLTWTEQYAFLVVSGDGRQDVAHLQGGVRLQLNGLAAAVEPSVEGRPPPAGRA
jgi:uncharacterized protein YndB with AHSA1/START domain